MDDTAVCTLEVFSERITAMQREIDKLVKSEGEDYINSAFKEVFERHPCIESIEWTQYTPYFNDGMPCYFSIHEFYVAFNDLENPEWDNGYSTYSYEYQSDSREFSDEHIAALKDVRKIEGAARNMDDAFETIFGDHVKIIVTKDQISVDEYDHD